MSKKPHTRAFPQLHALYSEAREAWTVLCPWKNLRWVTLAGDDEEITLPVPVQLGAEEWEPNLEQVAILKALAGGKALRTEAIAAVIQDVTGADRRTLFKSKGYPGHLDQLKGLGLVDHARARAGYFLTEEGEELAERLG